MLTYLVHSEDCFLQVYERGNGSESILLLLHGGPGSGAKPLMELSVFQTLEKQFLCVYFDQRGSGNSTYDLTQGLSIQQLTNDVQAVAAEVKQRWHPKRLVLWGGSFGGTLACLSMERFPTLADLLILCNPAITFHREQALALFKRSCDGMQTRLQGLMKQQPTRELMPELLFQQQEFRAFIFSPRNPSSSLRHIAAMSDWFYRYDATTFFKTLSSPTLVMLGQEDPICDAIATREAMQLHAPNMVKTALLANCGHAIFEDQPTAFLTQIQQFLFLHT